MFGDDYYYYFTRYVNPTLLYNDISEFSRRTRDARDAPYFIIDDVVTQRLMIIDNMQELHGKTTTSDAKKYITLLLFMNNIILIRRLRQRCY